LEYTLGGVAGFKWEAVAERLKLHNLWDRDVESKLAICEVALVEVFAELRSKENDGTEP
jgi:hypothetical protein